MRMETWRPNKSFGKKKLKIKKIEWEKKKSGNNTISSCT